MKNILFLLILGISLMSQAFTGTLTAEKGVVADGYNFWLYNPDSTRNENPLRPLVIFLHGSSLCGNNLDKVRRYGTIDAIEKGREFDAFVVAPQNPGGSWKPAKINAVLEWVCDNYNIDKNRIYVLGMSLGGYGTLDMVAAYPEKIAAAMAFCGGATSSDYKAMSKVPLWIVHGTGDRAVSVSASDKVVQGIKNTGDASRLVYHRVPGMNHGRPSRYFYLQESYDWLFSHSLADDDRTMNRHLTFDASKLTESRSGLSYSKKRSSFTKKSSYRSRSKKRKAKR